ncbi:MAG: translocation and assembly module TamA [Alphaproteobacteria bacterium]|jgi:translocation and assembly module TamA
MPELNKWTALFGRVAAAMAVCVLSPHAIAQSARVVPQLATPTASETTLKYQLQVVVDDRDSNIEAVIKANSSLAQHQSKGVPDAASLVARARTDEKRLVAALYGEARYGGKVEISIAGKSLKETDIASNPSEPLGAASTSALPVTIAVSPGDEFRFGKVLISSATSTNVNPTLNPGDYGLASAEPARSAIIVAALGKIVEQWRAAGYPFASIGKKDISADHVSKLVDVQIVVNPGAPAVYGWINVVGPKRLSNRTVAEHSALKSGKRYHPADLVKTRERLRKLESIESVRIIEGKSVDGQGGIPITLAIKERKRRYIGATASVTTLDGAEVEAHWGHRNLFGEGETLRIEGAVSRLGTAPFDELEYDASATLTKPGILDIDTDLFTQFRMTREANDVFLSDTAFTKVGLNRRFNPYLRGSIALEGRFVRSEDEFGKTDYALVSLPGDVSYDTRNSQFDPSSGVRSVSRLAPVINVNTGNAFVAGEVDAASYWALDEAARAIVAVRVRGGTILGGALQDIPATYRFLAGGGNSVRGYEHRSLGSTVGGRVVGGLSYASSSLELRLRPTKKIGIVPFVDMATVSVDRVPKFSDSIYVGAGVGLRYFTPIGPVRLDVAVPLTNRQNRSKYGIYVGLGQAF